MIADTSRIEKKLTVQQRERDKVMELSRETIRLAGRSITLMHARENTKAMQMLARLKAYNARLSKESKGHEFYTLQASQEYAEAYILHSILSGSGIPGIRRVAVSEAAYLLGILDVVGELKREAFEELRHENLRKAELHYDKMVEIYDSFLHMRFANSIVPDLRKKQDTARIQIEGTAAALLSFRKAAV